MPWYFEGLLEAADDDVAGGGAPIDALGMWDQLFDGDGLAAAWGLTTAEQRHACFNYSWEHGDTWNQNSWPYETSRLLTGAANILNRDDGSAQAHLTNEQYFSLLVDYARQHTRTSAVNDTGIPHVFENVHPFLGYWNNRERMYWTMDANRNMGDHYLHSTYGDLVLSGLLGVVWDRDGTVYAACCAAGLSVFVDGELAAHGDGSSALELMLSGARGSRVRAPCARTPCE